MRISKTEPRILLLCVSNEDNPASLELWKLYRSMPDETAARLGCVRVIDESGEDYLYPNNCFVSMRVPASVQQAMLRKKSVRLPQSRLRLSRRSRRRRIRPTPMVVD